MKILRRLGKKGGTSNSSGRKSCPDFFELDNGDFALIGRDATDVLNSSLPHDAVCGDDERIIVVPRAVILSAKQDIPE